MTTHCSGTAADTSVQHAEVDGNISLPNPIPEGPAQYVLISVEPSLGRWARSAEDARVEVQAGFLSVLTEVDASMVHFAVSLIPSRKKLMFSYKLAFERMRSNDQIA